MHVFNPENLKLAVQIAKGTANMQQAASSKQRTKTTIVRRQLPVSAFGRRVPFLFGLEVHEAIRACRACREQPASSLWAMLGRGGPRTSGGLPDINVTVTLRAYPPEIATWEEEGVIHDDFIDEFEAGLDAEADLEAAESDGEGESDGSEDEL